MNYLQNKNEVESYYRKKIRRCQPFDEDDRESYEEAIESMMNQD